MFGAMKRAWTALVLLTAAAVVAAPHESRDAAVAVEIARLERVLASLQSAGIPEDTKPLIEAHRGALDRVKQATPYEYRLYRLRDAFVGIETLAFLAEQKKAGASVEAFEQLWREYLQTHARAAAVARGTLLERGLIESATTRSERLAAASLPYAKASAPWSGVYYLGEANANRRFAAFVRSAAGDSENEPGAHADRIAAMLDDLEGETLRVFGGDVTNQGLVAVSVRIKEARELLDAKRADGAALMTAEARVALLRRGGKVGTYRPVEVTAPASLTAMLEAWAASEQAPLADAIRSDALPYVRSMLLPPVRGAKKPSAVTVTLVRWPYT